MIKNPLDLLPFFVSLLAALYRHYRPGQDSHVSFLSAVVIYFDNFLSKKVTRYVVLEVMFHVLKDESCSRESFYIYIDILLKSEDPAVKTSS